MDGGAAGGEPEEDAGGRPASGAGSARDGVEQRLIRRHAELPAGLVLGTVARMARRLTRRRAIGADTPWPEVEEAADEELLLRQALRDEGAGLAGRRPRRRRGA